MFADLGRYLRPRRSARREQHARLPGAASRPSGAERRCASSVCLLRANPESRIPNPKSRTLRNWDALVHPGQKLKPGARMVFERDGVRIHGEVVGDAFPGRRTIRLWTESPGAGSPTRSIASATCRCRRTSSATTRRRTAIATRRSTRASADRSRRRPRACISRRRMLDGARGEGVERAEITLHVGYGTFQPVRVERVEEHSVDAGTLRRVATTAAAALTRAQRERPAHHRRRHDHDAHAGVADGCARRRQCRRAAARRRCSSIPGIDFSSSTGWSRTSICRSRRS